MPLVLGSHLFMRVYRGQIGAARPVNAFLDTA